LQTDSDKNFYGIVIICSFIEFTGNFDINKHDDIGVRSTSKSIRSLLRYIAAKR